MTVIICPACNTRFETAAVIPPTGRKVRCSKCGNVWQAIAVTEAAKPTVITAPTPPPVAPRPAPAAPRPAPGAPPPSAAPRPAPPEARPGAAGPGNAMGRFPGAPVPPGTPSAPTAPIGAKPNSGAFPGAGPVATPTPPPLPNKRGPLFGTDEEMQPDLQGDALAGMGGNSLGGETVRDLGGYNSGALVDPDEGLAANVPIAEGGKRKLPPVVAIGWGVLALFLALLAAFVAMAPKTVVSLVPGSAKLYAMMGMKVNPLGLAIENVRSTWIDSGPQRALQIAGDIVNLNASETKVPTVVISLRDQGGKELSQATATVMSIAPGGRTTFSVQIPSPPEDVRNLQVRFAKAQ